MQIPKNKTSIAIALILMFALVVSAIPAIPFVNAQTPSTWNISIEVTNSTGRVRIEVRYGSTRNQTTYTGVSLGYLAPGGAWTNVTGLTTTDGRIDYYLGTLVTNGVWQFQARVPAQAPLPANAATPDGSWYSTALSITVAWTNADFPSFCLVHVAPNPIGVGQPAFVNIFMSVPIVGATMSIGGTTGVHYVGMYVDITRPDGVKETFGPYVSDPTGGFWLSYTPPTVGNYTAQGRYLGQNYRDDNTANIPLGKYRLTSSIYLISYAPDDSPILTFTVQEEPVLGWAQPPLPPTEYWSRPITATNWDWGREFGSNWWGLNAPSFASAGGYDATGNVQPYGKAPNSPHIMWTKSLTSGGQPGGTIPSDQEGQFTGTSILKQAWQPISAYGIVFYQQYLSTGALGSGLESTVVVDKPKTWKAVDIRTGELLWEKTRGITGSETLVGAEIQKFHSVQEYGSWGAIWATGSGSMAYLYDLWTGQHLANVTNVSWGSAIVDTHPDDYRNQGGLLRYYVTGGNLTCWNSTRLFSNGASGQQNWTNGYQWSFNMTATYPDMPTSVRVTGLDTLLMSSMPTYLGGFEGYQRVGYMTVGAISARTGAKLWGPVNKTIPAKHDISMYAAREGAFVLLDKDTQDVYCYSLENGNLMWGPVSLVPYTNAWSYIETDAEVYGDKVIVWDFGGNVIGLDKANGTILWHYNRGSSGFVTPHGIYPIWDFGSDSFADGKAFFSEGSMYDVPLHPAYRIAINVTDGTEVWRILSFSGRAPGMIADGYLVEVNALSNEIVSFGKGPSATTVSIENDVTTYGHKVMVQGMVTDISPGTKAYNREARFPNGVPAISEEDQRVWMEYVYMQQVRPADAKGVEVVISVMDPNNNPFEVGRTTSDASGKYQLAFDPGVPGEYTVYATFAGSESYYGSNAQTALFVEEAPIASATPPPLTLPPTETYVAVGTGLIILAIAVVGLLLFRKH